tara:strand:- start:2648 stop:3493 length:846 start_codon:yes stop_codon:yes gene_type:complete
LKIVFIDDFYVEDGFVGGGELNNQELISLLSQRGHDILKINSQDVNISFLGENKNSKFIVSNFMNLKRKAIEYITNNLNYVLYEHDHKYLSKRNPAFYEDFKAPKDEIVNYDFYKNAMAVFCQSSFHSNIVRKNLELDNIVNLSGNLWSLESLEKIEDFSKIEKNNKCSILDSNIAHKNTSDAISYCAFNKLEYDLVRSNNYLVFLQRIGANNKLIFFPKTPETLSRIVVEARMMGMSVVTNNLVGATKEDWFSLKGAELIEVMKEKRESITSTVLEKLNG